MHSGLQIDVLYGKASIAMQLTCLAWSQLEISSKHLPQYAYANTVFRHITPNAAISKDSRAFSGMREIILRRLVCVRGL